MNLSPEVISEERRTYAGVETRLLRVHGEAPLVVLLHGYTDSADTWRGVLERLHKSGRAAIAVDLPGHGYSAPGAVPQTLGDLDAFVATVVAPGAVVIGNSLGALLALRNTRLHPNVARSVLALGAPAHEVHWILASLPRIGPLLELLLKLPVPQSVLGALIGAGYRHSAIRGPMPAAARAAYRAPLTRSRVREMVSIGKHVIAEIYTQPTEFDQIRSTPVTLWWGTDDVVCRPPDLELIMRNPGLRLAPGGNHCPQVVNPGLVMSLLDDHLSRSASETA